MCVPLSQKDHLLATHTSQEPGFPKIAKRAATGRASGRVGTGSEARQPSPPGPPRTRVLALTRATGRREGQTLPWLTCPGRGNRWPRAPWGPHPCPSLRATHSRGPRQAAPGPPASGRTTEPPGAGREDATSLTYPRQGHSPLGEGWHLEHYDGCDPPRGHLTQGPAIRSNATICDIKTSLEQGSLGKGGHDIKKG